MSSVYPRHGSSRINLADGSDAEDSNTAQLVTPGQTMCVDARYSVTNNVQGNIVNNYISPPGKQNATS